MNISLELAELLAQNPELSAKVIDVPASTIVNNLIEGLNFAVTQSKDINGINKHIDVVLLHAFDRVDMLKMSQCLDHLIYTNISRLDKRTYKKLLASIPNEYSQYKRIKGNLMFELCRHMPYKDAKVYLGVHNE